jgi:hypothetical protein
MKYLSLCCLLLFIAASTAAAQHQHVLVPAEQIPDEIAYTAFFFVVSDGDPSPWDVSIRVKWLEERGFNYADAARLIAAANRFRRAHTEVGSALAQVNRDYSAGPLTAGAKAARQRVRQRIPLVLRETLQELNTGMRSEGMQKLAVYIQQMKREIRMKAR